MIRLILHFLFSLLDNLCPMNGWPSHMFCLQYLVYLQKGQCESEPHQTKKFYIVFGPDQRKWTSWLSWCEYTFSKQASVDYHNKNKIFSAAKC